MIYLEWFLFILFGLIIPLFLAAFVLIGLICDILAAPFVPSSSKYTLEILERAKLKRNQKFLELGSGDGRVLRMAVNKYRVLGVGVELNPFLVWYSRLFSLFFGPKGISYKIGDIYREPISDIDVIFVFLTHRGMAKLAKKVKTEAKKKVLVISHGFKMPGFEKELIHIIDRDVFPTYYYKI